MQLCTTSALSPPLHRRSPQFEIKNKLGVYVLAEDNCFRMTRMTNQFSATGETFSRMRCSKSERQLDVKEAEAPIRQAAHDRRLSKRMPLENMCPQPSGRSLSRSEKSPKEGTRRAPSPPLQRRGLRKLMSERMVGRSEGTNHAMGRLKSERNLRANRYLFESSLSSIDSTSDSASRSIREERFTPEYWSKRYSTSCF